MAIFSATGAASPGGTASRDARRAASVLGGPGAAHREAPPRPRRRRAFGDWVLHAPQTLRALVRADEIWLVVLAGLRRPRRRAVRDRDELRSPS